jgi:hypothetical protein
MHLEQFQVGDRRFLFVRILTGSDFDIEMQCFYPTLVWNTVPGVAVEEVSAVIRTLYASGCRYVVAGGVDCERWHDIADEEFVAQFPSEPEQDENFVMTSWHAGESPADVAFFFVNSTNFDHHEFKRFVVLQFGEDSLVESQLKEEVRKAASPSAG